MSLHAAAQHLSTKGRGPDSMLVHMSPEEVHGLQALAKSHGGSLTINPDTGLVEAGFLSQILPVVAAAGLTYLTAGAAAPAIAAATGLGATSAGIIAGAGAGALINGGMASMQGKNVGQAALMGGLGGGVSGGLGAYGDANVFGVGSSGTAGQSAAITNADIAREATLGQAVNQLPAVSPTGASAAQLVEGAGNVPGLTPQAALKESALNSQIAREATLGNDVAQQGVQQGFQQGANQIPTQAVPNVAADTFKKEAANQYYQKLGDTSYAPVQKLGIQALPVLSTLDEQPTIPLIPEEPSKLGRISPNFYAQQPVKPNPYYHATYANGGTVEQMSRENSLGGNQMFPQSNIGGLTGANTYQNATNTPMANNVLEPTDAITDPYTGQMKFARGGLTTGVNDILDYNLIPNAPNNSELYAKARNSDFINPFHLASGGNVTNKKQRASLTSDRNMAAMDPYQAGLANLNNARYAANMTGVNPLSKMTSLGDIPTAAGGGLSSLGGYSDGGRMLKGPGDGMSDNIPASIGGKQPARLADGEFVVPADVVSHLGNGSTDAGAKRLYSMMDKVRQARTGKKKQAPAVNTGRFMPA